MLTTEDSERYLRHILLREIGAQGQLKLKAARILVVGAGGLGSPILFYLAAAGVGAIGVADDDAVSLSNLQRQILYADEDIGAAKTERAAEAMRRLNPSITIAPYRLRLTSDNADDIISAYDIIVEGVDSFETRFLLSRICIAQRKPLVSAAAQRFEGRVSVFMPWSSADSPCYRCLTPDEPPREAALSCLEEGVLGPVAGVIGSFAALEAIKLATGAGEALSGRLAIFDGLAATMRVVRLPRDPACIDCGAIARD